MSRINLGDIVLSFAAFFQITVLMLKEVLVTAQVVTEDSFRLTGILLAALPMIPAIYFIIRRRFTLSIGTYLLIIILILLTNIFFTDNAQYFLNGNFTETSVFYLMFINIPTFLCLAAIRDIAILKRVMLFMAYVIFILGVIYFYFLWIGRISYLRYSMTFSNYLLLPALIFMSQSKLYYMFLSIATCTMMLLLGSRGALIAVVVYIVVLFFVDRQSRRPILTFATIMVLLFGSFLTVYFTFASKTGVSSRTLTMFEQGTLTESSGRDWIYSTTWNSILDSPIWGHGIFGDRVILFGDYSHNMFLEMLHNFGLLLGAGLILFLLITTVRVLLKLDNDNKKLLLFFCSYCIIPLMVSSSYLEDPKFGMFIGSLLILSRNNPFPSMYERSKLLIGKIAGT